MNKHPLRVLREFGSSPAQLHALLAPDIVFHSLVLAKPISGREIVLQILLSSDQVRNGAYVNEFR